MIPAEAASRGPLRVLVVDDEEDIVEYLSAVLEDNGFNAIGASDADAALAATDRETPDLILLDIMMPGHSGLSLYKELRRREATAKVPVLIISGYSKEEDFQRTALRQLSLEHVPLPDGYLEKPISVHNLLIRLTALFERS
jgi:two-component system phosphate regulon response regulator PhoB